MFTLVWIRSEVFGLRENLGPPAAEPRIAWERKAGRGLGTGSSL